MKIYLKLTILLFLVTVSLSCTNSQPKKTVTQSGEINLVTPLEFKNKLENNTLIDIRTPLEFKQGHIEGAVNINMYDKDFLEKVSIYKTSEPIFIYCRSGNRTSAASRKMAKIGFTEIYDLNGGITNWFKNKLKIVK
ncbi:rhodanese-like domain-containing protein [Lutibacter citreus]|uniref:rhodanese-like domain-containing protein n=1 Tax=Lutibacter citreus TaxID=2138210 RepID=UPI00130048A3|nr:rhodanese-like domain-containing protein [Lutibacter citreus]